MHVTCQPTLPVRVQRAAERPVGLLELIRSEVLGAGFGHNIELQASISTP